MGKGGDRRRRPEASRPRPRQLPKLLLEGARTQLQDIGACSCKQYGAAATSKRAEPTTEKKSLPMLGEPARRGMVCVAGTGAPMYSRSTGAEATLPAVRSRGRQQPSPTDAMLSTANTTSLSLRLKEWGEAPLFEIVTDDVKSDKDQEGDPSGDAAGSVDVILVPLKEPASGLKFRSTTLELERPSAIARTAGRKRAGAASQQKETLRRVLQGVKPETLAPRDVVRVSWGANLHLEMQEPLTQEESKAVTELDAARAQLARTDVSTLHSLRRAVGADSQHATVLDEPGVRQVLSAVCSLMQHEPFVTSDQGARVEGEEGAAPEGEIAIKVPEVPKPKLILEHPPAKDGAAPKDVEALFLSEPTLIALNFKTGEGAPCLDYVRVSRAELLSHIQVNGAVSDWNPGRALFEKVTTDHVLIMYDEEEAYGDTIYACSDKVAEEMEEVIKKAEEIQNVEWEKLKKEAEKLVAKRQAKIDAGDYYVAGFAASLGGDPKVFVSSLTELPCDKPLPPHAVGAAAAHAEGEAFAALLQRLKAGGPWGISYDECRQMRAVCAMGQWVRAFLYCYRLLCKEDAHQPEPEPVPESEFAPAGFEPELEAAEDEAALCEVCFEPASYRISTTCDHRYCGDCVSGSMEAILAASSFPACCPACRVEHAEGSAGDGAAAAPVADAATPVHAPRSYQTPARKLTKGEIGEEALAFFAKRGVISHRLYYRCVQQTLRAAKRPFADFFICPGQGCTAALCTQRLKPLAVPLSKLKVKSKKGFQSVPTWKAQCPRCETIICNDCHLPARRRFKEHDGLASIAAGDVVRSLDCQACRPRLEVRALDPTAPSQSDADIVIGLRHTDDGFEVVPGEFSAHWASLCEQQQAEAGRLRSQPANEGQWPGLRRARSYLEGTDDAEDSGIASVGLAGYEGVGGAWWRVDTLLGLKLAPAPSEASGNDWRDATIVRSFANGHIVRWSDAEGGGDSRHAMFGVALRGKGNLRVPCGTNEWEHDCPLKRKVGAEMDKETERLMQNDSSYKKCPNCRSWLQRSSGCDVMLCGHTSHGSVRTAVENGGCGFQFNWRTGKEVGGARYNLDQRAV